MTKIDGGLRALLRGKIPEFHWTSIETGGTANGVPDTNYLAPGGAEGWIECKRARFWSVEFQTGQAAWLHRRARLGGRAWLAVRRAGDELWLVPGGLALAVERGGLLALGEAWDWRWQGGPGRWAWGEARALLAGPAVAITALPDSPGRLRGAAGRAARARTAPGSQHT